MSTSKVARVKMQIKCELNSSGSCSIVHVESLIEVFLQTRWDVEAGDVWHPGRDTAGPHVLSHLDGGKITK